MSSFLLRIQQHRHYDKVVYWTKAISITGAAQVIVQAVAFLSGILVIRLLPVHEYALYTLANTMLGTMTVLSDGGISTGVMAQGGKVWQDPEKLGAVLATGLDLRRKFAIGSLIVSTPILLYLLLHNGASWIMAILIVLSLIPAFYAALSDSLLEIVPKLHQAILPLQKNQVTVGVGRLALSAVTLFIFPWTFVAILASGFPRMYGNIQLRKISNGFVDKKQLPDPVVRKEILIVVKRSLPAVIYYCISGQITIWILSLIGSTTSLAQIGALNRISLLVHISSFVFSTLLVPRYARLKHDKNILIQKFVLITFLSVLFSLFFIFSTLLFSAQILWILGKNYYSLDHELLLNVIASCISLMSGLALALSSSRGWVINPYIYIATSIISIIIGVKIFNVSNLDGNLNFNIFISSIQLFLYFIFSFSKLSKRSNKVLF